MENYINKDGKAPKVYLFVHVMRHFFLLFCNFSFFPSSSNQTKSKQMTRKLLKCHTCCFPTRKFIQFGTASYHSFNSAVDVIHSQLTDDANNVMNGYRVRDSIAND